MTQVTLTTNVLLFDLDGTLVNSTPSVEETWEFEAQQHNLKYFENPIDSALLLKSAHGTRTSETFKRWFPYKPNDIDSINKFEHGIVKNFGHLAKEVNGATELLSYINKYYHNYWAIITSGTKDLAHGWFENLFSQLKKPEVFITANDVTEGKPNPEGYLMGFRKIVRMNNLVNKDLIPDNKAIVFEDSPVGIQASLNAGFKAIGIATTFSNDILIEAGAAYVVEDLSKVKVKNCSNHEITLSLQIS